MLEFCDWKPCLDTLPFVSSLHMNVTNGRMKELHSTTWPNYQADIGQMGDYSTKCHTPEDVKKKLFSHLSVCTLPFDSLPYDCAPKCATSTCLLQHAYFGRRSRKPTAPVCTLLQGINRFIHYVRGASSAEYSNQFDWAVDLLICWMKEK